MSVYTVISQADLKQFLSHYGQGDLVGFEGISSGIENTNYFVDTDNGRFVLTIFEHHTSDELPFFLDLTAFLSEHDIPCAHPVADKKGAYLRQLKSKPAALVQRLAGRSLDKPAPDHCAQVGEVLARMHVAGQQFDQYRTNVRGPNWWHQTAKALEDHIDGEDLDILREEISYQDQFRNNNLPKGIIHADLFRDNVLFEGDGLCGLIDFYYACTDILLYDVAVVINDWCTQADGSLDAARTKPLLAAYQRIRPLEQAEKSAYPAMLRAAALRFWLSRLYDLHFPREGEITHTKDPQVFKRILVNHRQQAFQLET
ncbi:MAG: homoserine kinase [Gammaproteobacteria bacterium]|nr:homoserine kinase [Gammaproteobacteria bacterium]